MGFPAPRVPLSPSVKPRPHATGSRSPRTNSRLVLWPQNRHHYGFLAHIQVQTQETRNSESWTTSAGWFIPLEPHSSPPSLPLSENPYGGPNLRLPRWATEHVPCISTRWLPEYKGRSVFVIVSSPGFGSMISRRNDGGVGATRADITVITCSPNRAPLPCLVRYEMVGARHN